MPVVIVTLSCCQRCCLRASPYLSCLPPCLLGRFLEEELARRYRDAAPATLALLQERCESVARELIAADKKLAEAGDVVSLRRSGRQPGRVGMPHLLFSSVKCRLGHALSLTTGMVVQSVTMHMACRPSPPLCSHSVRPVHCLSCGGHSGGLAGHRPHAVRLDNRGGAVGSHRRQRELAGC